MEQMMSYFVAHALNVPVHTTWYHRSNLNLPGISPKVPMHAVGLLMMNNVNGYILTEEKEEKKAET